MSSFIDSDNDSLEITRRHLLESLRFPTFVIVVLWVVHSYQYLTGFDAGMYGIMSRRVWGLSGIFTGPLVHGSWGHLISNSFPMFVLTAITFYFYRKVAMQAFWIIYFMTGAAVWLLARPVSHIGASGVVYGILSFIFWTGIFRRSLRSIILAGIVMLIYSGMFFGLLPDQEGISWESHLLGSIAGIVTAFWFKSELEDEETERRHHPFADEEGVEKQYFLPRNAFEKTKAQRQWEAEEEERRRQEAAQQNPFLPPYWNRDQTW